MTNKIKPQGTAEPSPWKVITTERWTDSIHQNLSLFTGPFYYFIPWMFAYLLNKDDFYKVAIF